MGVQTITHIWSTEVSAWELVLFFHHVGSKYQTQVGPQAWWQIIFLIKKSTHIKFPTRTNKYLKKWLRARKGKYKLNLEQHAMSEILKQKNTSK